MNISMRKIRVLFKKDFVDFIKNPSLLICALVPIFMVLLFRNIMPAALVNQEMGADYFIKLGTLFSITMCGTMVISTSVSEEKEKYTLRTLMLSNVSSGEFFLSKILTGYLITMLTNLIMFFMTGVDIIFLPSYFICATLGTLCVVILGGTIGILARDQMTCGVYQIPVLLLFMLPTMLGHISKGLAAIAVFTPLNAMMELFGYTMVGALFTAASVKHIIILLFWIIFSFVSFSYVYRRKGVDN